MESSSKKTGIMRLWKAFLNSKKGFIWLIKNEAAFQQEMLLFIICLPVIVFVDVSQTEKILLFLSLALILLAEVINTAIEVVVDRIGKELHELSGLAKDLGSLLVLMSVGVAILVWGIILIKELRKAIIQ
jgi:diacylglycerol kinase (ATP)